MPHNPTDIAQLLPHSGNMVLLDRVISHDALSIHCLATSHHAADNPLRENGHLPAWCGIEYAAQAMAIHQRLSATAARHVVSAPHDVTAPNTAPTQGVLAVARDIHVLRPDLDGVRGDLQIYAKKIAADSNSLLYQFNIESAGETIVTGRATVVIQGARAVRA